MSAGIKYNFNSEPASEELCRFETVFRHSGGFNLEDPNLPEGSILPVLCPLAIDFKSRKAVAIKNVKIVEDVATDATSAKVAKGSLAYVGMLLGTGSKGAKVTAIDKSDTNYDALTLEAAFGVAVKKDAVLFESSAVGGTAPKNLANKLNYARTKVESGATVTAIGRAFEIYESKLPVPISDKDKESLGDLFMFVY